MAFGRTGGGKNPFKLHGCDDVRMIGIIIIVQFRWVKRLKTGGKDNRTYLNFINLLVVFVQYGIKGYRLCVGNINRLSFCQTHVIFTGQENRANIHPLNRLFLTDVYTFPAPRTIQCLINGLFTIAYLGLLMRTGNTDKTQSLGVYFAHFLQFTQCPHITSSHYCRDAEIRTSVEHQLNGFCKVVSGLDLQVLEFFGIPKKIWPDVSPSIHESEDAVPSFTKDISCFSFDPFFHYCFLLKRLITLSNLAF